jgi:hypothetical protein
MNQLASDSDRVRLRPVCSNELLTVCFDDVVYLGRMMRPARAVWTTAPISGLRKLGSGGTVTEAPAEDVITGRASQA